MSLGLLLSVLFHVKGLIVMELRRSLVLLVWLRVATLSLAQNATSNATTNGYNFVNPLIGTANGGTLAQELSCTLLMNCRPCISRRNTSLW